MDNYPYMDYTTNSPDYIEPHMRTRLADPGKPTIEGIISIIGLLLLIIIPVIIW